MAPPLHRLLSADEAVLHHTYPAKRPRLSSTSITLPSTMVSALSTMSSKKSTILLTPTEEMLRRLLIDCATHMLSSNSEELIAPLELRFTGGWVRDKLLGNQSNDIDVGIDKVTGFKFASCLAAYITDHGCKYGIETGPRSIHKIECNPEKSKHLETATTRVLGLDVDFVNLRSEAYSEDSRIPVSMAFGSPLEDALRRDATVNALFYNLHTEEVEDYTGRGLMDLEEKLIRTPLKPLETFQDDPLRVLRLVRFASRLGFEIVPEVKEAMRSEEIKKSIRLKISRERVGTEVNKMLKGKGSHKTLGFLTRSTTELLTYPSRAKPLPLASTNTLT